MVLQCLVSLAFRKLYLSKDWPRFECLQVWVPFNRPMSAMIYDCLQSIDLFYIAEQGFSLSKVEPNKSLCFSPCPDPSSIQHCPSRSHIARVFDLSKFLDHLKQFGSPIFRDLSIAGLTAVNPSDEIRCSPVNL